METAEHAELGAFLKQVRTERGCSQVQLAGKMRVTQSFVSNIESGERQFQLLEFFRFCECLEVEPEDIIKRFRDRPVQP